MLRRIGKQQLGRGPTLVLALSRNEPLLRRARELGVQVVELRIDGLVKAEPRNAAKLALTINGYGLPIIATVRSATEGGAARLSDTQRRELYESVLGHVDAIDIEIASAASLAPVISTARQQRKTVLLSSHDFQRTPTNKQLMTLLARGQAAGADIVKIAATPKSRADVVRLLEFTLKNRHAGVVVIAMGALGALSRVAFPLAGSLLTYTNVKPTLGQLPLRPLVEQLRMYYPPELTLHSGKSTTPRPAE